MSVYIKGVEKPKSCASCFMICNLKRYNWSDYRTPDFCPIVSVPPHGDLIERKEIGLTDLEIIMCDGDYKEALKMLLERIESAPVVIKSD